MAQTKPEPEVEEKPKVPEFLSEIPEDQILKINPKPEGRAPGIVGVVTKDGKKFYVQSKGMPKAPAEKARAEE